MCRLCKLRGEMCLAWGPAELVCVGMYSPGSGLKHTGRKVCAAPQFVSWAWDASQGAPGKTWENLSGEWAGLACALGVHLCWACGTKGLRRQQKGGKSCFSRVNLFNTSSSAVGHGLLRDSKSSEKKNCPLGSPQWFCCRNVISFHSILSSHLGKPGAENQHQRRGITSATTNVPF